MLAERKTRLLGHIIRTSADDPLSQVCFDLQGYQHIYDKRRIGRPRNHWVRKTMENTYNRLFGDEESYNEDDEDIILKLFSAAAIRMF